MRIINPPLFFNRSAAIVCVLVLLVISGLAQGPVRGPISAPRDIELEKQSYRNLDVAKFYYQKRKPEKNDKAGWERINKAVESRLMEIIDTNPQFARMDEVYFLLGEVYHRGGDVEAAREHWGKVVKNFPDSEFVAKARKRLDEVAAPKSK
jgi:outer membrane protein assembly factor BamD (BamD/ComL family)